MTALTSKKLFCLCFAITLCLIDESANAQTQGGNRGLNAELQGTEQRCVLLKKTDRVLAGKVRQVGNNIEIEIADQSRVSIAADQVAYVGLNQEDVYQFKKSSVARWAVGDHFQLTRWCIQNGLLHRAIEHYLEVNRHASQNEAVQRLGAELEQKILADEDFRRYAGLPPRDSAGDSPNSTTAISRFQPATGSSVAQASHSNDRNQNEVGLAFQQRIQPILINRCSQAACHGSSSSNGLRLIEPAGKSYARVASENLRQVLANLDRDPNGVPKLIRFASQPHGLQRSPGIGVTEGQLLDEIKRWISLVDSPVVPAVATQTVSQTVNGATTAGGTQTLQPAALNALTPVSPGASQLRSVPKGSTPGLPPGESGPTMSEIDALDAQLNRILSNQTSTGNSMSGDPFDPAEFNRQVGQSKKP